MSTTKSMDKITALVTIATESHLNDALLMLRSAPNGAQTSKAIYLIGSNLKYHSPIDGIIINRCEDVIDGSQIKWLTSRYTASEVCYALKPLILLDQINRSKVDFAHYVDSDILFYEDATKLNNGFLHGDIILTPHYTKEFPLDNFRPGVLTLLRGGSFNAGYIGIKNTANAIRFLNWWYSLVRIYGYNQPLKGMSGDQRWLDLAPALFDFIYICKDPGVNVGYWNMHERELTEVCGSYFVGNRPLIFFHFSGFDDRNLSRYQNRTDCTSKVLRKIINEYRELRLAHAPPHKKNTPIKKAAYSYRAWWHRRLFLKPGIRSVISRFRGCP